MQVSTAGEAGVTGPGKKEEGYQFQSARELTPQDEAATHQCVRIALRQLCTYVYGRSRSYPSIIFERSNFVVVVVAENFPAFMYTVRTYVRTYVLLRYVVLHNLVAAVKKNHFSWH